MVEPLPAELPIWNTGGGNRVEPLPAEKISGWAVDDQPPSSYFNWLQYYTGAWFTWLSERLTKGSADRDVILNALTPTSGTGRGGDLRLNAADANSVERGGNVIATAGDAGSTGNGGAITLTAGQSTAANGGNVTITAGSSPGTGGGDATIIAGSGTTASSPPGDITLRAGDSVDSNAGDAYLIGGDSSGTNRNSGFVEISTGASTGNAGGQVAILVAEDGAPGSGSNSPTQYALFEGIASSRTIYLQRHVRFNSSTATDPARGNIRLNPKTQPTTPLTGDIYHDSGSEQVRVWDGSTYRGMNSKVYATTADSLAVDDTLTTEKVFQLTGPVDLKYVIPANYIGTGAGIRVHAGFERSGTLTDEPGFNIRLGSYGGLTGVLLASVAPNGSTSTLVAFVIDLEIHLRAGGAAGQVRARTRATAIPTGTTWQAPLTKVEERDLTGIAFNGGLDLYPTVVWNSGGGGAQTMLCSHFTVDLL